MAYGYYYFNKNLDPHGRHEVHTSTCSYLPDQSNRVLIGYHVSCTAAITAAKISYPTYKFDGCYWCCRECHKG